jgi:hypothetical protein
LRQREGCRAHQNDYTNQQARHHTSI